MASKNNLSVSDVQRIGRARYGRANSGVPGATISMNLRAYSYGAIALAVANAVSLSQSVTVGTTPLALINGGQAASGVATFVTPRNVVAAWTGTAVLTITGTDEYGAVVTEASASGTSLTGKKAFKTVTSASFSADVTGATIGNGVVIGLPQRVDANMFLVAKQTNTIDAATFVPADTTNPATTTTGDIRGTITFASAPDGTKTYGVFYAISDVHTKVGTYGLKQSGSSDVDPV